ncbi:sulfocyanin-like copper-binding protein [Demequina soli]|uniref:sulfocyanin-like copper-binding protein n=1 Tax=Demequina soli TaxID=1638987 RepID=UPI0007816600|nr:sulfocyanin-like copper-binding protein [Demequina soli]
MTARERGWTVAALVAAVAALVVSFAWALGGGPASPLSMHDARVTSGGSAARIADDAPPGTVVDVYAMDMGGRGMMGGRMMLRSSTTHVDAGTVTLRLVNEGTVDHELVVLPLADGASVGQRSVSAEGTVDESDSLGEASATDAAGAGDGIAPGASGWVTLDLAPGRYELVCNIEGHYAAGMRALLVVD